MIRANLTTRASRLQRQDTWGWADPGTPLAGGVQCPGAPAKRDPSRTAGHKGFP